jgi:hypothetical protein
MVRRAIIGVDINELEAYISFIGDAIINLEASLPPHEEILLETLYEWLLAIRKRDVGVEERHSNFSDVLIRHSQITADVEKEASLAYLVSVFPTEYLELSGISYRISNWEQRAWEHIEQNIESPILAYIPMGNIFREIRLLALSHADEKMFVENLRLLDGVLAGDCGELKRFCFLSYYAEMSASALRTFGLHFFFKNFPRLEIIRTLEEIGAALLRAATMYKGAFVIEFDFVRAAANTFAAIASSMPYSGIFLRADLNYQLAESLIEMKRSPGWFDLLHDRCVNLNNWARYTRELRWADLSLSLLREAPEDDVFSLYLRGFAHYTKAIVAKERSSALDVSFNHIWLGDLTKALKLCFECAEKLEAAQNPDARAPRQLLDRMRKEFQDVDLDKFVKPV